MLRWMDAAPPTTTMPPSPRGVDSATARGPFRMRDAKINALILLLQHESRGFSLAPLIEIFGNDNISETFSERPKIPKVFRRVLISIEHSILFLRNSVHAAD
ncbi:hypothetical protein J2129_000951 [Methanofollis sp. W23]|nr:hypothetical protein [Methanofollis sp. W23]